MLGARDLLWKADVMLPARKRSGRLAVRKSGIADELVLSHHDDRWALEQWIATYVSDNSARCARKEGERLMMFLAERHGHRPANVKVMDADDADEYIKWLTCENCLRISPRTLKAFGRGEDQQPIKAGLAPSSARLALRYLGSWFAFMAHLDVGGGVGYRQTNPFFKKRIKGGREKKGLIQQRAEMLSKVFSSRQFMHCVDATERGEAERPQWRGHYVRARLLLWLLVYGMFRRWEAAPLKDGEYLRWGNLHQAPDGWVFSLTLTKGGKARDIAVAPGLLAEIIRYRDAMGLKPSLPTPQEDYPVVADVRNLKRPVGDHVVYKVIKTVCEEAAAYVEAQYPEDAAFLRKVTPHYLRHTGATRLVEALNGRLIEAAEQLGHASITTTQIYVAPNQQALQDAVSKMKI